LALTGLPRRRDGSHDKVLTNAGETRTLWGEILPTFQTAVLQLRVPFELRRSVWGGAIMGALVLRQSEKS